MKIIRFYSVLFQLSLYIWSIEIKTSKKMTLLELNDEIKGLDENYESVLEILEDR